MIENLMIISVKKSIEKNNTIGSIPGKEIDRCSQEKKEVDKGKE